MPLPDIDDYTSTYGGSKSNYAPIEDPTTDEDAAVRNQYVANIAMMSATCPRALVRFTAAATTGAMVLVSHIANWGTGAGVAPTIARSSTGVYTITWPTTVLDAIGNSHTTNFRYAFANIRATGTAWEYNCVPTTANIVTVYTFNSSGVAADAAVDIDLVVY